MAAKERITLEIVKKLHIEGGMTMDEIGKMHGVSRQRVHQIIKNLEKSSGEKLERRVRIDILALKRELEQGLTAKQIAQKLGMHASKVSRAIRKHKEDYEKGKTDIKIKRKTAEDFAEEEELRRMYLVLLMTDKEIGGAFGLSASTVGALRKRYGIPTIKTKSSRKLPRSLPKEKLERMRKTEGMTLQKIADAQGCSVAALMRLEKQYETAK